jgi:hypothetical protein
MQDQCGAARSDTSGGQRLGKRVRAKDNQSFLHARFGLGDDVLKPYKETLERWL